MKSLLIALTLFSTCSVFAGNAQLLQVLDKSTTIIIEASLTDANGNQICKSWAQENYTENSVFDCGNGTVLTLHWLSAPAAVLQDGKTYISGTIGINFNENVKDKYGASQIDLIAFKPGSQTYEKVVNYKYGQAKLLVHLIGYTN